jgi:hypothetical protein
MNDTYYFYLLQAHSPAEVGGEIRETDEKKRESSEKKLHRTIQVRNFAENNV